MTGHKMDILVGRICVMDYKLGALVELASAFAVKSGSTRT
jgi:hypothetical protein